MRAAFSLHWVVRRSLVDLNRRKISDLQRLDQNSFQTFLIKKSKCIKIYYVESILWWINWCHKLWITPNKVPRCGWLHVIRACGSSRIPTLSFITRSRSTSKPLSFQPTPGQSTFYCSRSSDSYISSANHSLTTSFKDEISYVDLCLCLLLSVCLSVSIYLSPSLSLFDSFSESAYP